MNRIEGGDGMRCLLCKEKVDYEALSFWEEIICYKCEKRIMNLNPMQSDYQEVLCVFRQLWQKKYFHEHDRHFLGSDQI